MSQFGALRIRGHRKYSKVGLLRVLDGKVAFKVTLVGRAVRFGLVLVPGADFPVPRTGATADGEEKRGFVTKPELGFVVEVVE